MSKIYIRIMSLIAIVAVVGWLLIQRYEVFSSETQTSATSTTQVRSVANRSLPVTAISLSLKQIADNLTVTGTIEPDESVEISSEIDGKVKQIFFEEGRRIGKNDMLIKIVDDDLQAELKKAQFEYDLAVQKEQRRQRLLEKGGLSQEEYDEARTEMNTLNAEIDRLKIEIEKTELRAPFNGVIGFRYVSQGSYLNPGSQIARIVKVQPIKVAFSVPEKYSQSVTIGQEIAFTIEGIKDTFEGNVYAKDPAIDPETRTQLMKAKCNNSRGLLLPGSFTRIVVPLEQFEKTLVVPSEAIIPELGKQKVFVYKNGVAIQKEVQTGLRQADNVQILAGLQVGDTVITSGMLQLKNNTPVEIEGIQAI